MPDEEARLPQDVSGLFPQTAWSRIVQAGREGVTPEAEAALAEVCRRYWQPARKFLRHLGCGEQDAEDLTQEFFSRWATAENLQRMSPEKGRLRSYLKQALRRCFINAWRAQGRIRRGGGMVESPFEEAGEVAADDPAGDLVYDAAWAAAVVTTVVERLRNGYAGRGKAPVFDLLRGALPGANGLQPYAEIAVSAGVTEPQIKLEVHRLRRRFADELRAEVSATLARPEDLEDELRHLLRVMAHENSDAR